MNAIKIENIAFFEFNFNSDDSLNQIFPDEKSEKFKITNVLPSLIEFVHIKLNQTLESLFQIDIEPKSQKIIVYTRHEVFIFSSSFNLVTSIRNILLFNSEFSTIKWATSNSLLIFNSDGFISLHSLNDIQVFQNNLKSFLGQHS